MWGGDYIVIDDNLEDISKTEVLFGLSTYLDYEEFEMANENLQAKSYYEKLNSYMIILNGGTE